MSTSNILIKKAFAENAGSQYRFEITDTNETDSVSKATFDKGFPPASMLPEQAGGEPPHGEDFNGILYVITKNQQHAQAGNLPRYDASFATAIGGYNINSEVSDLSGNKYRSLVDNNTAELTDTASWVQIDALEKGIGGTVSGDTNFTGKLQNKGSDVVSKATALTDLTPYMLGWGQTWQDVTADRSSGVEYVNRTGKPIFIAVYYQNSSTTTTYIKDRSDGDTEEMTSSDAILINGFTGAHDATIACVIPAGYAYKVVAQNIKTWKELR